MKTQNFSELAQNILALPNKHRQKIIAIDGGGGAGKSTFAEHLQAALPNAYVVHIDDFYIGPWDKRLDHLEYVVNPLFDWQRLKNELLEPVQKGEVVTYHIYNWHTRTTEETASIPPDAVVVLEGMYTTQSEFSDMYDYKIWIEADVNLRLEKAMLRDGEHMRFMWEEDWLPIEKNYREKDNPMSRSNVVVQGHTADFSEGFFEVL